MVRRGGGAGGGGVAVASVVAPVSRAERFGVAPNNFPESGLRRLYPWSRDNRFGTDIIAGGVDDDGAFKGMVIKDAQLHTLLRYLALARSHLPETLPPEVQAVRDGYPTVVLTRGVYGRELDHRDGPVGNSAQEALWEAVRKARADNPRMRITCVDVPVGATTAEVGTCLEPPLSDYQELAYYDGTWYTPDAQPANNIVRSVKEFPRKTLYQTAKKATTSAGVVKQQFNRKPFGWVKNEAENDLWTVVWKPVYTDAAHVPPPVERARLAVDATA